MSRKRLESAERRPRQSSKPVRNARTCDQNPLSPYFESSVSSWEPYVNLEPAFFRSKTNKCDEKIYLSSKTRRDLRSMKRLTPMEVVAWIWERYPKVLDDILHRDQSLRHVEGLRVELKSDLTVFVFRLKLKSGRYITASANALTPAVQALFARVVGYLLNEPSLAVRSFWNWDNTNSHPSGLWFTEPREDLWRCRRDPCVVFRTVSMSTSIGEKSKRPRSDRSEKLDERCSTRSSRSSEPNERISSCARVRSKSVGPSLSKKDDAPSRLKPLRSDVSKSSSCPGIPADSSIGTALKRLKSKVSNLYMPEASKSFRSHASESSRADVWPPGNDLSNVLETETTKCKGIEVSQTSGKESSKSKGSETSAPEKPHEPTTVSSLSWVEIDDKLSTPSKNDDVVFLDCEPLTHWMKNAEPAAIVISSSSENEREFVQKAKVDCKNVSKNSKHEPLSKQRKSKQKKMPINYAMRGSKVLLKRLVNSVASQTMQVSTCNPSFNLRHPRIKRRQTARILEWRKCLIDQTVRPKTSFPISGYSLHMFNKFDFVEDLEYDTSFEDPGENATSDKVIWLVEFKFNRGMFRFYGQSKLNFDKAFKTALMLALNFCSLKHLHEKVIPRHLRINIQFLIFCFLNPEMKKIEAEFEKLPQIELKRKNHSDEQIAKRRKRAKSLCYESENSDDDGSLMFEVNIKTDKTCFSWEKACFRRKRAIYESLLHVLKMNFDYAVV